MPPRILATTIIGLLCSMRLFALPLREALAYYALHSPQAMVYRLELENSQLEFENYQKGFLPSVSFSLSPLNLNQSLKLLQDPMTGDYTYVRDYSNSSLAGLSINQRIGVTGGSFSLGTSLNYLREFSAHRNTFNSTPIYISYSQPLLGEYKLYKRYKEIMHQRNGLSAKTYCESISTGQNRILALYLEACSEKLQYEISLQNLAVGDTLLRLAKAKYDGGIITQYDYNQVELRQLQVEQASVEHRRSYAARVADLELELGLQDMDVEQPEGTELPMQMDYSVVLAAVSQNNPQYLATELHRKEAEYNRDKTLADLRFNGNVSLSYGLDQYGETFQDVYRHPNQRQSISITLSFPVFQWGINHNKRRMAKNEFEASIVKLEQAEREFDNSIRTKVEDYNADYRGYLLSKRYFSLSQEQYRLAVRKFGAGKVSTFEVISAHDALLESTASFSSKLQKLYQGYYGLRHLALYDFIDNVTLETLYVKPCKNQ